METIFENHCIYTFRYYLQLKRKTMDRSFVNTCITVLVIFLALGILSILKEWYALEIFCILAVLFAAYRLWGTPLRLAMHSTKQNRRVQGRDVDTVNEFYEDHLEAVNTVTGGKTSIEYDMIHNVKETKNLYIIGMDKGLVLLLDKDGFTKGTKEDFAAFMREKCPDAEVEI